MSPDRFCCSLGTQVTPVCSTPPTPSAWLPGPIQFWRGASTSLTHAVRHPAHAKRMHFLTSALRRGKKARHRICPCTSAPSQLYPTGEASPEGTAITYSRNGQSTGVFDCVRMPRVRCTESGPWRVTVVPRIELVVIENAIAFCASSSRAIASESVWVVAMDTRAPPLIWRARTPSSRARS